MPSLLSQPTAAIGMSLGSIPSLLLAQVWLLSLGCAEQAEKGNAGTAGHHLLGGKSLSAKA